MHSTAERVRRVRQRAGAIHRKREGRITSGLGSLSVLLTVFLIGIAGSMTGAARGQVPGLYGSMLLFDEAGGYVLVSVLSFAAAVFLTVFCIKRKDKTPDS